MKIQVLLLLGAVMHGKKQRQIRDHRQQESSQHRFLHNACLPSFYLSHIIIIIILIIIILCDRLFLYGFTTFSLLLATKLDGTLKVIQGVHMNFLS